MNGKIAINVQTADDDKIEMTMKIDLHDVDVDDRILILCQLAEALGFGEKEMVYLPFAMMASKESTSSTRIDYSLINQSLLELRGDDDGDGE